MRYTAALTLVAALLAAPVSAATYTFSFDGNADYPGRVSGLIEGLLDDGLGQQATGVFVTSVIGSDFDFSDIYGINLTGPRPAKPGQFVTYSGSQSFDITNGAITLGEFLMFSQGLGGVGPNREQNYFDNYLCFFSASSGEKRCPGLLRLATANNLAEVSRRPADGPSVAFARVPDQPSPVPLPAGAGLLAAGLVLLGLLSRPSLFARRRKLA
jgi:hypothetical protein